MAVDMHDVLGLRELPAHREAGGDRQVRGQRHQLAVGARRERHLQPLIEFLRGQPAITGRHPEHLDEPVPVLVRSANLTR